MREAAGPILRWGAIVILPFLLLILALLRFGGGPGPGLPLRLTLAPEDGGVGPTGNRANNKTVARAEISDPERQQQVFGAGFVATGTPSVSYDGRHAIFAGRRAANDPMQIWEISLTGSSPRLLVSRGDAFDPAYLPDGRIVYARSVSDAGPAAPTALYTVLPDGQDERRITFGEARDRAPAVLLDGRIAFRRHPMSGGPGRLFVITTCWL